MLRFALLLLACSLAPIAQADEVRVAVASNFSAPMKELAARFEQSTGHKVLASFGSTGKFYAQIRNGAPFDMLLAADATTPARLEKEGGAAPHTRITYAIGKLVLWSPQPGLVDDKGDVLRKGAFSHVSMADPKLAPYGAAAVQVLQKLGLNDALRPKLVQGENIGQAWQYVVSGAAPLGFVAMSQVVEGGKLTSGSAWIIPANLYAPIRQDAVVLTQGKSKKAVDAFMAYLKSDQAAALIRSSSGRRSR